MKSFKIGSFEIPIRQHDALCWLDVKHSGGWEEKFVAGGYGAFVCSPSETHHLWGYGGVRSTELLYLHGLSHIIHTAIAHGSSDEPSIVLFVPTKGFLRYFRLYPRWSAAGGKDTRGTRPEAYEDVGYCYHIAQMGKLDCLKVTAGHDYLPVARDLAWRSARLGERRSAQLSPGIALRGDTLESLVEAEKSDP